MGIPVCSNIDLFDRLSKHYSGACMLVKATPSARDKLYTCGYKSFVDIINKLYEKRSTRNAIKKLEYEDENEILSLLDADIDTSLLNAVESNIPNFDIKDLEFVGYPLWFTEWAVTLAKILRSTRHKTLGIPLDAKGLMVCCTSNDDAKTVMDMLGELESNKTYSVVIIGEGNFAQLTESLTLVYKEQIFVHVLNDLNEKLASEPDCQKFAAFFMNVEEHYISKSLVPLTTEHKQDVASLCLKLAKSKSHEPDYETMKSIFIAMQEETLSGTSVGYVDLVSRGCDHELQGIAYVYSAISNRKMLNKMVLSDNDNVEYDGEAVTSSNDAAIVDLDKAISIFLKYNSKTDALLAAILAATIGGTAEATKMASISATMELNSKADFVRMALSLESSTFFTTKHRKRNFNLVMAGNLYSKAGIVNLTKRCYMLAVPMFNNKGWNIASDYLYGTLSRYNPLYCIDALNELANQYETLLCNGQLNSNDAHSLKSSWYISDREMAHLRRLMKLSVIDPELRCSKIETPTVISPAYKYNPGLVYDKADIPKLNGDIPYLVRVPFIFLRNKGGVHGRNCGLLSTRQFYASSNPNEDSVCSAVDDFELQESTMKQNVKTMSENDATWKRCYDFISDYGNISYKVDSDSGYFLPKESPMHTVKYTLNEPSIIKLELINPLNIGIHCDDFHLLIKGKDSSWWETASMADTTASDTSNANPKDNFVYLSEGDRRTVYLKFCVSQPGTYKVCGFAWKLFGCVTCWVPLYLCGSRKTRGAPLAVESHQTLDEYAENRKIDNGLSFTVTDTHPEIAIVLSKVAKIPPDAIPLNMDCRYFSDVNDYLGVSDTDAKYETDEGGNLSKCEAIAGEYVITKLTIKNIGTATIDAISLSMKTSGRCIVSSYPFAYHPHGTNINVMWEDPAKCNLGSISGNKSYQVTLKNDVDGLISANGTITILILMVPRVADAPSVICMQGRVRTSSKCYNVDGNISFWRFYTVDNGLDVSYEYDHSLEKMVKCSIVNNSKADIKSLCLYGVDKNPIKTHIETQQYSNEQSVVDSKRNSILLVSPFNPEDPSVTLKWKCGEAVGLQTDNIFVDSKAHVLVKITSDVSMLRYEGAPILVHIKVILENPTDEVIPYLKVKATKDKAAANIHAWYYVGLLTVDVPQILPRSKACIVFDAILPLPGVYSFTYKDINITPTKSLSITPCIQHMISVE